MKVSVVALAMVGAVSLVSVDGFANESGRHPHAKERMRKAHAKRKEVRQENQQLRKETREENEKIRQAARQEIIKNRKETMEKIKENRQELRKEMQNAAPGDAALTTEAQE